MSHNISIEVPLFAIRGANMQAITDQPLIKLLAFTNWFPTKIVGLRQTGGATIVCAGGIYTGATKTGTAIVAAGQSWLALTGTLGMVDATIVALAAALTATPILSLTTGSTGAITADVLIFGVILD